MTTKPTSKIANAYPLTRLAQMFAANRETMRKRLELVVPADPTGKGRYTPAQVLEAYLKWESLHTAKSPTAVVSDEIDGDYERARKDREMANKYEIANQVRRGELVEASDVKKVWAESIHRCRSKLLALPSALAPVVITYDDAMEAQTEIESAICDALSELADGDDVRSEAQDDAE